MTRPFWQLPQVPTRTAGSTGEVTTHACNCIGPQNGQPRCPCQMQGIVERDGRWVQLERDLGPVLAIDIIRNLSADFGDDGNCCVGKLADATKKESP